MLDIFFRNTELNNRSVLPDLASRTRTEGGSVVVYTQIYSFLFFSVIRTIYQFVPHGKSRSLAGLKHSIISAVLGWWSVGGLFLTGRALVANSAGGVEITHLLNEENMYGLLPIEGSDDYLEKDERKIAVVFLIVLLVSLGLIIWKMVLPVYQQGP